ncbi:MAG: aldehyde dehydrogenase, partial [Gaiellaceae bacterium]|nr:aldehyde dehydrogenase [Gaiellaceae bacterium]
MAVFEYAPAPESVRPVLKPRYDLFIGGAWRRSKGGALVPTINPATEEPLTEVVDATAADVDAAVAAAADAYRSWSRLRGAERGKHLYRLARLVQEKSRELAVAETLDGGKPIRESRDVDLPLVAAHLFHHAGWADTLAYALPGREARPLGVCGAVIPWNFPLLMAAWKIAPALACGNT